ncbi:hypothetical protein GCM10009814_13620 [Lapillicoccus jejuensis]
MVRADDPTATGRRRRPAVRWAAAILTGLVALAVLGGSSRPSPDPTPAPWHPVFFGLDVPNARTSTVASVGERLGTRPTVAGLFIRYDSTWTASALRQLAAARLTPFVTLEPWHVSARTGTPDPTDSLAELLTGRFDAALARQARALASSPGPIYLRFAHEMNGDWYPWSMGKNGNTPQEYVAAWRHVHALFARVAPALRVRWVFAPAALGPTRPAADLARLYPGRDVVDALGLTGYEHGGTSPWSTFGPTVDALSALGPQPVLLAEIGVDGAGKATWLRELGGYLRGTARVRGFVYFDTTPATTGATGDYALGRDDLPALRAALREVGPASP